MTEPTSRTKVLFIITKSNWGGAQRYVYDLVTHLDLDLYEPVVALGGDGKLHEMLHLANIRTIALTDLQNSTGLRASINGLKNIMHVIRAEKPAVLHLNSSVAGFLGVTAGRLGRVPRIIFTAHGWAFNEDRPLWQRLVLKCLHYMTVLLSHHTIAVSQAIVKEMNWPLAAAKMTVIHPGRSIGVMFDRAEARTKIADFYPVVQPHLTDLWIVCVAELHKIKRHQILFEAVRSLTATLPHVRLLCFGEGAQRKELDAWVIRYGMQEHIFILGNLHEAARFLPAFDVFALASKSESYGYVLHEAGLAGVPIVATNVGGIPDIVTPEVSGLLVAPDNVTDLAGALYYTLTNSTASQKRAATLKSKLQERNVATMVSKTVVLY
jgi:glycosyltransferase involved in cell wall biosynthesis